MKALAPTLVLLLLSVFAAIDSYAATLTVTRTADTNDGVCDADCSLREAVSAAASGDTIVFSSLFNSPQTVLLTLGQITINKNLTITGTSQDLVTVSGNNSSRIFFIIGTGVTVNISRMTFRDGNGQSPTIGIGGAIRVIDSTLNASNATFTNNRTGSQSGGGGAIDGSGNSTLLLSDLLVFGNISLGSAISSTTAINIRDSVVRQNTGGGVGAGNTANVERCLISDNTVGGVGARHLTIIDSTIANNSTLGGVSDGDSTSTMTIERCLISGNSRLPTGGGVKSVGTTVIRDSQIINNSASNYGGGISNLGTLHLINSVVANNNSRGDGGGGIRHAIGAMYITNSTISGNTTLEVPALGGGIDVFANSANPNGRLTVTNSTISNNRSRGGGGGIYVHNGGTVTIRNSLIAGNKSILTSQLDVSGVFISQGTNLVNSTNGSSGWIASDLLNINPMLAPLGNNGGSTFTHALLPGSPAINAGNTALAIDPLTMLALKTDQRGYSRVTGEAVDIGAYEASYSSSPVTVSGRITTYSGRGIDRTRIKIEDGQGSVVYTQTNPFGYYRLNNLMPGTTYTITVTHKLYLFTSPLFFTADQDRDDLNFITGL